MKVSNGKCVRRLAWKSLAANRTRNLIAVLAIALTAVLFTSLFTIALSINEGIQQSNFRQVPSTRASSSPTSARWGAFPTAVSST